MYEQFLVGMIIFVIVWLSFIAMILHAFEVRKTKRYRRELGDLYVAAKIKDIAKGEDLDLEAEKELFIAWNKKNKVRDKEQNYDDVVEDEMMEKVAEVVNPKAKKETKKETKK